MGYWILRTNLTPEQEAQLLTAKKIVMFGDGLPDLTMVSGHNELRKMLVALYPEWPPETLRARTDYNWDFLHSILPEDVVGQLLPSRKQVAFGRITGPYHYDTSSVPGLPHTRPVEWVKDPVPLEDLKDVVIESGSNTLYAVYLQSQSHIIDKSLSIIQRGKRYQVARWLMIILLLVNLLAIVISNVHDFLN